MAGTKIKHNQDKRTQKSNHKKAYPVEHMEVPTEEINENSLIYFDHKTREKNWMTEKKIERLGIELLQWVETPEATKLSKFFHNRRITNQTVLEWCKKWPTFAEDYQLAKEIVGDRREDGALNKIFDAHFIRISMPMYDEDWKNETIRLATLKIAQEQAQKPNTIIVEMVDYSGKRIEEKKEELENNNR
jgi:hypothetical protein